MTWTKPFDLDDEKGRCVLKQLSLNHATIRDTPLPKMFDLLVEAGISSVGLWREHVTAQGTRVVLRGLLNSGLRVSSYTTGGFVVAPLRSSLATDADELRRSLDDAAELGAGAVVIRGGGIPVGSRNLEGARQGVAEVIAAVEPHAASAGVPIALEPLHPMVVADRGVVVTLDSALDIVEAFDPGVIGVVLDVYNSWWDPRLIETTTRAADRIKVVQIADWKVPFEANPVHSRAMIGDGSIDFAPVLTALRTNGYGGDVEVEIFNESLWAEDPRRVISQVKERFKEITSTLT